MKLARSLKISGVLLVLAAGAAHAADAGALWEKNCNTCHGMDGKGDTKAGKMIKVTDLTSADVKSKLNADVIRKTIEQGVPDKDTGKNRMKPYKDVLSGEEIDALVKHVQTLTGTH